jgi:hypothetical protein
LESLDGFLSAVMVIAYLIADKYANAQAIPIVGKPPDESVYDLR